jgi:hypothetical protein
VGKGENKSRGTRSGADEPKNVRELERVVGWRTLIAFAESNRISATRLDSRLRTLTPYLLYFSFASLSSFYYYYFSYFFSSSLLSVPPPIWSSPLSSIALRFPLSLSTHAVNLNPSCQPSTLPVLFPHPIPTTHLSPPISHQHSSLSCLQKVAQHQGLCAAPFPLRGQLARSSLLPAENVQIIGSVSIFPLPDSKPCADSALCFLYTQSAERGLGVHRRCARGRCFERGLGRRSNPLSLYPSHPILTYTSPLVPTVVVSCYSRRTWYDYALRDHHPKCRVHVPFL